MLKICKNGCYIIGKLHFFYEPVCFAKMISSNNLFITNESTFNNVHRWNDRELKFARTVIFTVEEINRDTKLLPGVSLGYRLYNGCGSENLIRAAVEAVNGEDSKGCSGRIQAVLGHSSSGVSEDINIISYCKEMISQLR